MAASITSTPKSSVKTREKVLPGTDVDFDSVSEVDQEMLVGERRESDWLDARKAMIKRASDSSKPTLEDGAD